MTRQKGEDVPLALAAWSKFLWRWWGNVAYWIHYIWRQINKVMIVFYICLLFVLCLQKDVIEGLKSKKLWYPLSRAQVPRLNLCVAVYNCWSRCSMFWKNWVTVSICPGCPGHSWSLYRLPVPKTRSSDHCWLLFAIVWRAWPEAIRELWNFQNWVKCPPAPLALTSRLARSWPASLAFISRFLRNSRTCRGWMCLLKGIALWEPWSLAGIRSIIIENEIKFSWK